MVTECFTSSHVPKFVSVSFVAPVFYATVGAFERDDLSRSAKIADKRMIFVSWFLPDLFSQTRPSNAIMDCQDEFR